MNHENIDGNTAELLDEIRQLEAEIERGETILKMSSSRMSRKLPERSHRGPRSRPGGRRFSVER